MIGTAFAAFQALSTGKKVIGGLVALLAIGAMVFTVISVANNWYDKTVENAEETGSLKAEKAGQDLTLEQIGKANDAENKIIRNIDNAKFVECLRGTRIPSSCDRYKPVENKPMSD